MSFACSDEITQAFPQGTFMETIKKKKFFMSFAILSNAKQITPHTLPLTKAILLTFWKDTSEVISPKLLFVLILDNMIRST